MSREAACDPSIQDLFRALNEKLSLEYTRLQKTPISRAVSEVSEPPIDPFDKRDDGVCELHMQIESLETKARDVLRSILSLRNTLQPVNRLPPEILSHIARHVHALDWINRGARPIVTLTHVCRYWRESIVSTPENWTLISDTCSEDLVALSLERNKAALLDISLHGRWGTQGPRLPDILMSHSQAVVILAVDSPPTLREFTERFPSFPQSMPNLRSLTLKVKSIENWDLSIDPFESLPHTLTYLELAKIPFYPSFLRLKTLTRFSLAYHRFNLRLDTLLDFLEANASLESVELSIEFVEPSLRNSQRRAAIENRLLRLKLYSWDPMDGRDFIANIPLQKGACLDIYLGGRWLKQILSGIPTTHLLTLPSPTFMQYKSSSDRIRLQGPNGIFSFSGACSLAGPFADLIDCPLMSLTNVREFHVTVFTHVILPLPHLPALETFVIQSYINVLGVLSPLLSNPTSSPSLKTIAFLNCDLSEDFMKKLTQFAFIRKNTSTSAWLHRVLIFHREGCFPSTGSIQRLRSHVGIVDVRTGDKTCLLGNPDFERHLAS